MIRLETVTKIYAETLSVDNLSMQIAPGDFYGLLGPNGAGKTTTIRMITALTNPTKGKIMVKGCPVHRSETGSGPPAQ